VTVHLKRKRMCEHRHVRPSRPGRWWDLVRRGHSDHVCDRVRAFTDEHIGGHVCDCGVRWE
jgi:hypothetical protein